ncbi:MAG: glycosyltransferase family 2 protein [Methanobrevibacter sp.]|nr:glycosyltransferase family 2 protein [Methanobrevibacter sp.]
MVEISVIIPVYNVEKYLRECLDSAVNQTFKDMEIICINDGSTDNSLNILEEYQSLDDRIIIFNQDNQGPGAARNLGIKKSKGKYVYFLDSDDYLELNALEDLYAICEEKSLDFVLFKLLNFKDDTGKTFQTKYYNMAFLKDKVGDNVFSYKDLYECVFHLVVSPPAKLYRRDLIEDIDYPEGIIFEDNVFFIKTLLKAKRIYFHDKFLYNRRRRDDSLTSSGSDDYYDIIPSMNYLFEICRELDDFELLKRGLYYKKFRELYIRLSKVNEIHKEEFFNLIKDDCLKNKEEIDRDIENDKLMERSKFIYDSALSSDNYKEFEYAIQLFDKNKEIKDLKEENKSLKNEVEKLKKSNKKLKKEKKHFKSSKAYKIWRKYADIRD